MPIFKKIGWKYKREKSLEVENFLMNHAVIVSICLIVVVVERLHMKELPDYKGQM